MNEFRLLNADEIEVRVAEVNQYGARLLLYMSSRAPMDLLDESVGPLGWKRQHSRENANCTVSIWDEEKQQWVTKEDTGVESNVEKEKGLASDSFKRACVNWGIGRELYSAPDIFIFKDHLSSHSFENGKGKCYDRFVVTNIAYNEKRRITAVEIGVLDKKKAVVYKEIFRNSGTTKAAAPVKNSPTPAKTENVPAKAQASPATASFIADDEEILLGNCRGKKYGEVKDTPVFKSFLNWVAKTETKYTDERTAEQFRKLKALATSA